MFLRFERPDLFTILGGARQPQQKYPELPDSASHYQNLAKHLTLLSIYIHHPVKNKFLLFT